ncbi:hypothetical protein CO695_17950 [Providencia alcalifaciens]|uniref:Uncharacterized protein n=2 Tax=Providencia alcalifaciens TaxID=126385 RepID=B6XBK6_9GAMM|nr:hypothetical protein CO695_17950 [Providencia alcalifaciens]EEB47008.1 hypothetical protein PROVALCAL_00716 [Providencia alcalifaciens DSM 30120]
MGISMDERMQQLFQQKNTKGIGENSVNGGQADNCGENTGVIKSGNATDSGKGGGSVNGGHTVNHHTNSHIIKGGDGNNEGLNNGGVEGGHSTNFGLNNNELNGGSALNRLGSTNSENSFIKGGNAIRELQSGIEKYQGMQKQLADANKEIIRKNNELLQLQKDIESQKQELQQQQQELADQKRQSQEDQNKLKEANQRLINHEQEKAQLNNELSKAKQNVEQLHSDMQIQRGEIDRLKALVDQGKKEIQSLEAKLEQANGDKNKLEERLKTQQDRNKKQEEKITELQCKIDEKNKKLTELNEKLLRVNENNEGLNARITRLNNDLVYLTGILDEKVRKESECSSKVSNLKDKIDLLEVEKKQLADRLQHGRQSYSELEETYRLYQLSVKTDMETFKQLKPMLSEIGALATQGEEMLNDPTKSSSRVEFSLKSVEKTTTPSPAISAGTALNSGTNSGSVRGGDSISNSVVVGGLAIEDELIGNKLAESMSDLAQTLETIAQNTNDSVNGAVGLLGILVETKTPYQVW